MTKETEGRMDKTKARPNLPRLLFLAVPPQLESHHSPRHVLHALPFGQQLLCLGKESPDLGHKWVSPQHLVGARDIVGSARHATAAAGPDDGRLEQFIVCEPEGCRKVELELPETRANVAGAGLAGRR